MQGRCAGDSTSLKCFGYALFHVLWKRVGIECWRQHLLALFVHMHLVQKDGKECTRLHHPHPSGDGGRFQSRFLCGVDRILGLDSLKVKFESSGWVTFNDFAFSTSDCAGKDPEKFENEVLTVILNLEDAEEKKLVPRLRRLYAQSYIVCSTAMEKLGNPGGIDEKVTMHPANRPHRTTALKYRIV